ncbi:MAG: diguanylate cyclase [Lachnospiraceae bacterium]|nr:diguanylate cyclase [Lachnospiraceae bacterium]
MLKKFVNSKALKVLWLTYALFSIGLVLYLLNGAICMEYDKVSQKTVLEKGWDIRINGKNHKDVDITTFDFEELTIGDKIVMTTDVPTDWTYNLPSLTFYVRQTAIRVLVDGKQLHEYGWDRIENKETVGCGYQFIDFNDEYKGKEMIIEMEVGEHRPFRVLDPIFISESQNALKQIVVDNRLPLIIGSFLVVIGVVICLVSAFGIIVSRKYMKILFLAAFSVCIGIWTLCYYDLLSIFALPVYTISLLEYMTLFMMPIPLTAYMYWHAKALKNKVIMYIHRVLFTLQTLFSVTIIILHAKNIVHGAASLPYFQVLLAVWAVFTVYVLYKNLLINNGHTKFFFIGMFFVVVGVAADMLNYSVQRYTGHPFLRIKGMSSLGIFTFLVFLLFDLYCEIVKNLMEDKEKKMLIERAYTDDLTGLSNHRFCAEYLKVLEKEENRDYAVISIDLNNLKVINDKYGHLVGDELLIKASKVLTEAFTKEGIVGRLGGDEFIAVIKSWNEEKAHELINNFEKLIKDNEISLSYGYALASEVEENSSSKVYQKADERMYAQKRKFKEENAAC